MASPEAASSLQPDRAAALIFVSTHLELYARVAADPTVVDVIDGCRLVLDTLPADRQLRILATLGGLHAELAVDDPFRILRVRDRPLYSCLLEYRSEQDVADLKAVAAHFQVPQSLLDAIDRHDLVEQAKASYEAALSSFDPRTAVDAKPRLWDFLRRVLSLQPIAEEAFWRAQGHYTERFVPPSERGNDHDDATLSSLVERSFRDGMMGESLGEYGYKPSGKRVLAYATGCVVTGRPIPFESLPPNDDPWRKATRQSGCLLLSPALMAASMGKIAALQELLERGWDWREESPFLISAATRHGHAEVIRFLQANCKGKGPKGKAKQLLWPSVDALCAAITSAHSEAVSIFADDNAYLESLATSGKHSALLATAAAKAGNFPLLKLFDEHFFILKTSIIEAACKRGDVAMMAWARDKGVKWPRDLPATALEAGRMDMFEWVRARKCRRGDYIFEAACKGFKGDTSVLETLSDKRDLKLKRHTYGLVTTAASLGHIHVLEWMATRPFFKGWFEERHYFKEALKSAARSSQLEAVQWLMKPGRGDVQFDEVARWPSCLPFSMHEPAPSLEVISLLAWHFDFSDFYADAFRHNNLSLARKLVEVEAKPPCPWRCRKALRRLGGFGDDALPLVRLLNEEVKPLPRAMVILLECAAAGGGVRLAEYLLDSDVDGMSRCATSCTSEAVSRGYLPFLRWLRRRDPKWPLDATTLDARFHGEDEVAAFLVDEHGVEDRLPDLDHGRYNKNWGSREQSYWDMEDLRGCRYDSDSDYDDDSVEGSVDSGFGESDEGDDEEEEQDDDDEDYYRYRYNEEDDDEDEDDDDDEEEEEDVDDEEED